jgi:Zn-dependent alcohol dehydrogenase
MTSPVKVSKVSRRNILKTAAAASGVAFAPQTTNAQGVAQGGRRFRAFVRHGTGTSVEELRLLPIQPREVVTRGGGHIVTLGFGQRGNVSFPASSFANRGRTFHAGQQGGLNMMRDMPRYVRLIERGVLDIKSMITATYPLERTREAVQAVADRTVVGAVITFS